MSSDIDALPVSPPGDPATLAAHADTRSAYLREVADTAGLTPAEQATTLLNVSSVGLVDLLATGVLDGVIVGGKAHVVAEQVQLRILDEVRNAAVSAAQERPVVWNALRTFLAARPVVALWDEAIYDRRPLVCARRGSRFTHFGLRFHAVVLKARWLVEFVADPHVRERYPELAALPLGDRLVSALVELPGVAPARFATPLSEQGEARPRSHRLSGWVRVDPSMWPVAGVDGWMARLINEGEQP